MNRAAAGWAIVGMIVVAFLLLAAVWFGGGTIAHRLLLTACTAVGFFGFAVAVSAIAVGDDDG